MANKLSDKGELIRLAIQSILQGAHQPMSASEIAEHPDMVSLGATFKDVTNHLYRMIELAKPAFPLRRTYVSRNGSAQKWGYYIEGVTPVIENRRPAKPPLGVPPMPQMQAAPPEFQFNPVEFAGAEPQVTVPPGVKSITLTVGGVNIRIELT